MLEFAHQHNHSIPEISTGLSLVVVAAILTVITIASMIKVRHQPTLRAHAGSLQGPALAAQWRRTHPCQPYSREEFLAMNRFIPRHVKNGSKATPAHAVGTLAVGSRVIGPSAMAPIAIAATAVGAMAIGRLAIADAVIRRLRAGEIEIGSLKVGELEVAGRRWPEA